MLTSVGGGWLLFGLNSFGSLASRYRMAISGRSSKDFTTDCLARKNGFNRNPSKSSNMSG